MDYEKREFDFATYNEREAFRAGVEFVNDSMLVEIDTYENYEGRFVVEYMEYK